MAIEFARLRYIKRSDGGNVCRSAAYNARSDVYCERTGERFFFAHRDGHLHHEVLLPEGADERFRDTGILWNAAQAAEKRKDSQEAREILLALPSNPGLGLEDWQDMAAAFCWEHFVSKGVAVQLDIHWAHEGEKNVHAHILVSTRRLEGGAFSAAKARDLDPDIRTMKNGARAVTEAERWGVLWRDFQNAWFKERGLDIEVDEIGIVPQTHEGPVRLRTRPEDAKARAEDIAAANAIAARDPEQILEALTRRLPTFTEWDIDRLLKKHVEDLAERAALRGAVLAHNTVIKLYERDIGEFAGRFTTEAVRAEELAVMNAAFEIGVVRDAVAARHIRAVEARRSLDAEQRAAFLKATGTDGLVVVEGMAGAGKSYSVSAIREAHERAGWRVLGLAPTNTVADDLRRAGFEEARTIHLEMFYQEKGLLDRAAPWDRKTLVIVDEAAMLDTRSYEKLMRRAAEAKAKVVLVGDDRQLASVERGGMFTAIKERHGSAVISKVRRQGEDWQRQASEDFSERRVADGLRAYSERGHVHWSDKLDESRARLLSDWDQRSRERPEINRFVYASTNKEVNALNQDIREIRLRRGEVTDGIEVETVRGKIEIGEGDRIQFHGNDRKAGIYNSALGTVERIEGTEFTVRTDAGREVQFDAAEFNAFSLGYAGTVYRGQGKTQTEVYALYDNAFAWNARTAYVGLTRHQDTVELYVSTDLAKDEISLASQMSRKVREEASLTYATEAEVISLQKERAAREERGELPREKADELRKLDLAAYAQNVHGYVLEADPRGPDRVFLVRERQGAEERLEARRMPDGRWTWRDATDPSSRGDVLDFEKRLGAGDLRKAREAVEDYIRKLREAEERQRQRERERQDLEKDGLER